MTELLHMRDNYIREFDAVIQKIRDGYVILDCTAFYPEGGGQSGDRGTLSFSGQTVQISGTFKEKGEMQHRFEGEFPFQEGDSVHGTLDWDWRYECMRFHTGQHILSKYLQNNYGLETVGNNISPGRSRADFTPLEDFDEQMKRDVEVGVNELLSKNMDVEILFLSRHEAISYLTDWGYQQRYLEMVPKSVKEFRIIKIGDYDASSCAGTHVSNTREIGTLRIGKSKNVGAGKRRIYFRIETP